MYLPILLTIFGPIYWDFALFFFAEREEGRDEVKSSWYTLEVKKYILRSTTSAEGKIIFVAIFFFS